MHFEYSVLRRTPQNTVYSGLPDPDPTQGWVVSTSALLLAVEPVHQPLPALCFPKTCNVWLDCGALPSFTALVWFSWNYIKYR